MEKDAKKCKGITKKGKPCNKYALVNEEYCEKHHPAYLYKRRFNRLLITNAGLIVSILIFVITTCEDRKAIRDLKSEIKTHSFAERIMSNQYNPIKLQEYLEEFYNLMNIDLNFKKAFYIDSKGLGIITEDLIYNDNFIVEFWDPKDTVEFNKFIMGGSKNYFFDKERYKSAYILKEGNVVDSIKNSSFTLARNFPSFPMINLTTIDPTNEFISANLLDIQIDSVINSIIYMSNEHQNCTFKASLKYDLVNKEASFDQLRDLRFDSTSSFYSIEQEISYYEFLHALLSNAKIRIRNATTGDSIFTSEPFLPFNIDGGESFANIINKLNLLNNFKKLENRYGVNFQRSNITKQEFEFLYVLSYSETRGSQVTVYPFQIKLPYEEGEKIIALKKEIASENHNIFCNSNSKTFLGEVINLGQIVIKIPPSLLSYENENGFILINFTPLNSDNKVLFNYTELSKSLRPGNTLYYDPNISRSDQSAIIVKNLEISPDCLSNIEKYEGTYFDSYK